jgi:predicted transcriptional regulator
MKVGDICKRAVISTENSTDITAAAELMREHHVGFLIVYKSGDELRRPIGVLTDRDIVIEVVAKKVDPASLKVDDLMTRQPLVANESEQLGDVLQAMRMAGIRRVPVVDTRGALTGVIAIDDAFDVITGFMCDITGSVKNEQRQEWHSRGRVT